MAARSAAVVVGGGYRAVDDGRRSRVGCADGGYALFDWHHTDADSFDKLVLKEFQANVASLAVMSYVLADMPERLNDMK